MLRRAVFLSLISLAAGSARAADKETQPKPGGANIDLAPAGLPVVVGGQVVNYVFVSIQINLAPSADLAKWRTSEPLIRDALVKAAHRTPFTRPDDYLSLDEARLRASVRQAAVAVMGPKDLRSVVIVRQIPQKRTGLPRPKGPLAPPPNTH
jgi:hypothetical protein